MVKKKELVFIDSNIFVIDLRYKRDPLFSTNRKFIDKVSKDQNGVTSIINLLEVCGILSFNLNKKQLVELYDYFPQHYGINVLPSLDIDMSLPSVQLKKILDVISRKLAFGDALIVSVLETYITLVSYFVTWDHEHFKNNIKVDNVITPEEYLSH